MEKLGSLGVGSILQNGGSLGPGHVLALSRVRELEGGRIREATANSEISSRGAVLQAGESTGSRSTADPAGLLGDELVEPRNTILLQAVKVSLSQLCKR